MYSAGEFAVAGAVGGAVGSVAGQVIANIIGVQDGFSFKEVLATSAAYAVGNAFGGSEVKEAFGATTAGTTARLAAAAAITSAASQGVRIALNLQSSFSWQQVAASAIAAPIAATVGKFAVDGLAGSDLSALQVAIAGGVVTGATQSALVQVATGGKFDYRRIATDAFGNAFANALASASSGQEPPPQDRQPAKSAANNSPAVFAGAQDSLGSDVVSDAVPTTSGTHVEKDANGRYFLAPGAGDNAPEFQPDETGTYPTVHVEAVAPPVSRDSIRNVGLVEGFFIFNPIGQTLSGIKTGTVNMAAGTVEMVKQTILTANDGVGVALRSVSNAVSGSNAPYPLDSALGQSIRNDGWGDTALYAIGNIAHGLASPITGPIGALYRHDARAFGESIPNAAASLVPASRVGTLVRAGRLEAEVASGIGNGEVQLSATQLRNTPGVATVSSELMPTSGRWLDASVPTPIPAQVGDALVGQSFNTFGDLRQAIWEHIGSDAELNSGFSRANLAKMNDGLAPSAPTGWLNETGAFGDSFNIHHANPIELGGAVYDLSNLQIVSPRVHFDIHYGAN